MNEICKNCMWAKPFNNGRAECRHPETPKRKMGYRMVKEDESCTFWDTLDERYEADIQIREM